MQSKQEVTQGSFKIYFKDEVRRVGVTNPPQTFAQLKELFSSIFGKEKYHSELKVQYEDEDGDRVTVASEVEWKEALRCLSSSPIKKLFLSQGDGIFFKDSAPPRPLYFYKEDKNEKENENVNEKEKEKEKEEKVQRSHGIYFGFGFGGSRHQNQNSPHHQPHHPHQHRFGGKKRFQKRLDQLESAVPECLARFFPNGKIIPNELPSFLSEAVKVKAVPGLPHEVDLDVNVPLLKCALFRQGFDLIEQKSYQQAIEVYQALLTVWPGDALSHYNLACSYSLLNKTELALASLSKAIECGYRDVDHLDKDSDFDNLRALPEFALVRKTLVEKLACMHRKRDSSAPVVNPENSNNNPKEEEKKEQKEEEKQQPQPEAKVEVVEEVKQQQQPEEVKKVEEVKQQPEEVKKVEEDVKKEDVKKEDVKKEDVKKEDVKKEDVKKPHVEISLEEAKFSSELKLLEDMGFADRQKNLSLLTAENGDLANVIHLLFQ